MRKLINILGFGYIITSIINIIALINTENAVIEEEFVFNYIVSNIATTIMGIILLVSMVTFIVNSIWYYFLRDEDED